MLEVENVGCIRGDRRLFKNISFSLPPGTFLQLTGPNGSGKTTLLRIICGLIAPDEGEIRWQGENIRSFGEEYFTDITYIGHRNGIKDELTSIENLRISNGLAGSNLSAEEAREILDQLGLGGREALASRLLSEGQRRRSALARLATSSATIWVLDEVHTSLDTTAVVLIKSLIEQHLAKGGIAIAATHQEFTVKASSFQRVKLAS